MADTISIKWLYIHGAVVHWMSKEVERQKKVHRPKAISTHNLIVYMQKKAPTSAWASNEQSEQWLRGNEIPEDLTCSICFELLDRPMELVTCRRHVCYYCLCKWLEEVNTLSCPCCHVNHLEDFTTVQPVSPIISRLIQNVQLQCNTCKVDIAVKDIQHHKCSNVTEVICSSLNRHTSSLSIHDILETPHTAPLTATEDKLATHLIKR